MNILKQKQEGLGQLENSRKKLKLYLKENEEDSSNAAYNLIVKDKLKEAIEDRISSKEKQKEIEGNMDSFLNNEDLKTRANNYMNDPKRGYDCKWNSFGRRGYSGLEGVLKLLDEKKDSWGDMEPELLTFIDDYFTLRSNISNEVWDARPKTSIQEEVKKLRLEEQIFVLEKLDKEGLVDIGCGGFLQYKSPTDCGGCSTAKYRISSFGLEEEVEFLGNRIYGIKPKRLDQIKKKMIKKADKSFSRKQTNLKKLNKTIENLSDDVYIMEKIDSSKTDLEKIINLMPEFIALAKRTRNIDTGVKYLSANIEENIGVILTDESKYFRSGGMEYGVTAIVFRDGKTKRKYFKWRDSHDSSKDDPSLNFNSAKISNVSDEGFDIELTSNSYTTKNQYNLKSQENKIISLENKLDSVAQKQFSERFEKEKERLVKKHYRENGMMPDYVKLQGFTGTIPSSLAPKGDSIPYEFPEIVDEFTNPGQGEGTVVIKAQIDHHAGRGLQHEWVAYKVSSKNTKLVKRDCAYQLELKDGKKIDIRANELLQTNDKGE